MSEMRTFIEMCCEGENSQLGELFLKGFIFIKIFQHLKSFFFFFRSRKIEVRKSCAGSVTDISKLS